jgi:hypothetical protein
MINIKKIILSKELGRKRRSSIWNKGRRGTRHPSSETYIRDKKTSREPRMTETGGKRPRKTPIQC